MSRKADHAPEDDPTGVRFVVEDDGRLTAVDVESGVASFGDTKAEALRQLADALDSHERAQADAEADEDIDPADAPWL